jgi:hypothetical protein
MVGFFSINAQGKQFKIRPPLQTEWNEAVFRLPPGAFKKTAAYKNRASPSQRGGPVGKISSLCCLQAVYLGDRIDGERLVLVVDAHGDLGLGCRDDLDLDTALGKGVENLGRYAGTPHHADALYRQLGHARNDIRIHAALLFLERVDRADGLIEVVLIQGEGNVDRILLRRRLADDVYIDVLARERVENVRDELGGVGHMVDGDDRLVVVGIQVGDRILFGDHIAHVIQPRLTACDKIRRAYGAVREYMLGKRPVVDLHDFVVANKHDLVFADQRTAAYRVYADLAIGALLRFGVAAVGIVERLRERAVDGICERQGRAAGGVDLGVVVLFHDLDIVGVPQKLRRLFDEVVLQVYAEGHVGGHEYGDLLRIGLDGVHLAGGEAGGGDDDGHVLQVRIGQNAGDGLGAGEVYDYVRVDLAFEYIPVHGEGVRPHFRKFIHAGDDCYILLFGDALRYDLSHLAVYAANDSSDHIVSPFKIVTFPGCLKTSAVREILRALLKYRP